MLATVFLGAVSAVSSFLQSVTGFGFGIVMMAVMPLFLEYHSALAISTTLSMTLNIVILLKCLSLIHIWSQRWGARKGAPPAFHCRRK